MVFTQGDDNNFFVQIPYKQLLIYFFPNVTYGLISRNGVAFFLILQTFFLLIFFLIALFLGLKILPMPLSELEKQGIILSPFQAFNKIFFSKTLFGRTGALHKQSFDLRNIRLNLVADLYLLHFNLSNKKNGFLFIFFILFMSNYFSQSENRAPIFQLLLNFCQTNIVLFLLFEFVIFSFSKSLIKGEKIG